MAKLLGHSITYRIAVGPQGGRKVYTLQTLPGNEADERKKLERLCRYISRSAVSEKRLSLKPGGNVHYQLKTPYRDGTTHVILEPLDFIARLTDLIPRQVVGMPGYWNLAGMTGVKEHQK